MPPVTINPSYESTAPAEQQGAPAAVHYERAEQYYRDGNLVAAVSELMEAVKLDPDYPQAKSRLEHWSDELEDVTHEVEQLREHVSRNPESAEGHYNLARKLRLLGDNDGALLEWKRVVELDQDSWGKSARKMLRKYSSQIELPVPLQSPPR